MTCDDFKKYITPYIDNELEEAKAKDLLKHMNECADCRDTFESLSRLDKDIKGLFTEKALPPGFEKRIINSLPEVRKNYSITEVLFMKKLLPVCLSAMLLLVVLLVPFGGRSFISSMLRSGLSGSGTHKQADMIAFVRINGIQYELTHDEIITDEKIIDAEIGSVKYGVDEFTRREPRDGDSSSLSPGTKLYSIKDMDSSEAIAAKVGDNYQLYRANRNTKADYTLFTEDMLRAEKIVVFRYDDKGTKEQKEIVDKAAIASIVQGLKGAEVIASVPNISIEKAFHFYFLVKDSKGIGKVARSYYIKFQDIELDGYMELPGKTYKLPSSFNKLLTSDFGNVRSSYDSSLGGKQQVYKVDLFSPKIIFRSLIREENSDKFEVQLLNEGEKLWQNGAQVSDNLKGKYKLQIMMKNTTIQNSVITQCTNNLSKFPGAVSISFTHGSSSDTAVMYIGFDSKPDYTADQYGDSFLLLLNAKR